MGLSSQPYLKILQGLNLYSPTSIYNLDNNKLNDSISTIGSLVSNNSFDFSNTLLSRVLGNNTPIQQIGTRELGKTLIVRFAKNLRTTLLPSISINGIFNLSLNKPLNYWDISGKERQTLSDVIKLMSGYEEISNPIPFISENFSEADSNNYLKKNRGEGQKEAYMSNIAKNKFSDEFINGQYGKGDLLDPATIRKGESPDSLLFKTNQLLDNNSLIDGVGDVPSTNDNFDIQPSNNKNPGNNLHPSAVVFKYFNNEGNLKIIPKGDGTTTDNGGTKFLRTFNRANPYDSTEDLMKFKHGTAGSNSVLQTVYPNIAPQDKDIVRGNLVAKNLMFSIENLAYKGNINALDTLKPSQRTVNGGRIMWFAPYDLQINENIAVGWEKVDFIGRSESIHTYNGSERNCNISFTLIADYPAELNNSIWKDKSNNEFNKYFRQDNNPDVKNLPINQVDTIDVKKAEQLPIEKPVPLVPSNNLFGKSNPLKYYFDNDKYNLNNILTQDNSIHTGQKAVDDFYNRITGMVEFLTTPEGKNFKIVLDGSSSALFTKDYNKKLSFLRARSVYNFIYGSIQSLDKSIQKYNLDDYDLNNVTIAKAPSPTSGQRSNEKFIINSHGESNVQNEQSSVQTIKTDIIDRYVAVYLEYNAKLDETLKKIEPINQVPPVFNETSTPKKIIKPISNEYYFERLKSDSDTQISRFNPEDLTENLVKSYGDNIKYFMPVFHSQTPIDLNERVTFIQQCTKQGSSLSDSYTNSIFGRPPVCILRLGDFFNTKIIITNVSLDYEPLIWDTNPEGIGMQPMICRVNMSCVIIGGSSLAGPVNKLQNALDYNYYANAEVYNKTALDGSIKQMNENNEKALKQNIDANSKQVNKL